jgi:hypothetical protein
MKCCGRTLSGLYLLENISGLLQAAWENSVLEGHGFSRGGIRRPYLA